MLMWLMLLKMGPQVLYIDKHLIHEVTSPQAFNELESRGIPGSKT